MFPYMTRFAVIVINAGDVDHNA